MNRKQLDALLAAGVITATDHRLALASMRDGAVTERPAITLAVAATATLPEPATAAADRTIIGDPVTAYDELIVSHNLVLHAGCFEPRPRVMLLRDHNQSDPVGVATSIDPTVTRIEFTVPEGENGDRALAEAASGLRAGLSVGFNAFPDGYYFDENYTLHITRADLYEVSLCAIPAVPTAGLTTVAAALANAKKENTTMNREQLAAALAAGTITQAEHDARLAEITQAEAAAAPAPAAAAPAAPAPEAPAAVEQRELSVGPTPLGAPAPSPARAEPRGMTLAQAVSAISRAANTGRIENVTLALQDVLVSDDAGTAFVNRADWLGELFNARQVERPWIDSFGVPAQLDTITVEGFRVTQRPTVNKYEGEKKDVPNSGTFKTAKETFTAENWAGGWDIERRLVDLGSEAFLTWFWGLAMDDYKEKSDADIAAKTIALANANATVHTAGGVVGKLLKLAQEFRTIKGARLDRIKLGASLFDEWAALKKDDLPHWLNGATTGAIDLQGGSFQAGTLHIDFASEVDATAIVGYDSRAAKVREKSPIEVRAYDIGRGGIDLGFYSYGLFEEHDRRLFRTVRQTALPTAS